MEPHFHYYATYCAAYLAGYTHEESMRICWSAEFVDRCTKTVLTRIKAPLSAATSQLQMELMDMRTDVIGLQEITRIWSSFHFLPRDLYAEVKGPKRFRNKYRLLCGPNGTLVKDTVELAKGKGLEAVGVALHVVADTWAHTYFIGAPSLVFNSTNHHFFELIPDGNGVYEEKHISFRHNPGAPDDPANCLYLATLPSIYENSIMNLGHGRASHLPDYSYARYKYMPSWADHEVLYKDNPSDFFKAFCQMIYVMKYIRGEVPEFETDTYDYETVSPWESEIKEILERRQTYCGDDWKAFGEKLSGRTVEPFDIEPFVEEYIAAGDNSNDTVIGRFTGATLAQKSMVTNKIYKSGNLLAGYSVDYEENGLKGIKDYFRLIEKQVDEMSAGGRRGGRDGD
ncbi:MAG: hypothetical protein J5950_09185 [Clostridia bacterium]|nr:hypothetical protein [Clostridia bacterium]